MALVLKKQIHGEIVLAFWKMEEESCILLDQYPLHDQEKEIFATLQIEKRKREWLVVRIMARLILGKNQRIEYKKNGQPFLPESVYEISISHSKDYASIIVSQHQVHAPGIDIEFISTRIEKIKSKFLSAAEIENLVIGENYYKQMLAHWCAKEVLVKICGHRGLDFINKLKIHPFTYSNEGSFVGEIIEPAYKGKFKLNYFEYDGYLIVWSK